MSIKNWVAAAFTAAGIFVSGNCAATPAEIAALRDNVAAYVKGAGDRAEIVLSDDLVYKGKLADGSWKILGKVPESMIEATLGFWSEGSAAKLATSSFGEYQGFLKMFVLSGRMADCESFDLKEVRQYPVATPRKHSERWTIDACGKTRNWHLYDERGQTEFEELAE